MAKTNILDQLHLKDIGILELLFAMTPILSGFSLSGLRLADFMWIILLGVVFLRYHNLHLKNYRPFLLFVVYWIIHEFIINFIVDPGYLNIVGYSMTIFSFLCVFSLQNSLDIKKLEGSLNWVALLSILGLLYQWVDVIRGISVTPIEIPGLQMDNHRMEHLLLRPSSFFMEPASYAEFMLVPIWLSLKNKQLWWTAVLIVSVLLTTSSTGFITTFIILGGYLLINKSNQTKLAGIILVFFLYIALNNFDVFSVGIEKIESINTETNVRLAQGPDMVRTMSTYKYIFGVPYATPYNYYISEATSANIVIYGENSIYLSTFWYMILRYGIIGLFIYLNIYYKLFKQYKESFPILICIVSILFSSVFNIGVMFLFTLIIILVYMNNSKESEVII